MVWPFKKREAEARSIENPSVPLDSPGILHVLGVGGAVSDSGVVVTPHNMIRCAPVKAAVAIIADTMASLPLHVLAKGDNGSEKVTDTPLYAILHNAPNPELSSSAWRRLMMRHVLRWGDHFSRLDWTGGGQLRAIYPLDPETVTVERVNGRLQYVVQVSSGKERYSADEILHIQWDPRADGLRSEKPYDVLSGAIGLAMACEAYGARFFANDARPGVVITMDGKLSPEGRARATESYRQAFAGLGKSHSTMVLDNGQTITPLGVEPNQAQFLETRQNQVIEIARGYGLPPALIQMYKDSPYAGVEAQDLTFAKHTIAHWCCTIEDELNLKLTSHLKRPLEIKFNIDGLQRGAFADRMTGIVKGVQGGVFSPNEARGLMDMPPKDGGDDLYIQQNMSSLQDLPAPGDTTTQGGSDAQGNSGGEPAPNAG